MPGMTFRKWGLWLLGLVILIALVFLVLVRIHIHRIYGGLVERADAAPFRTSAVLTAISQVSVLSCDGEQFLPDQTVVINHGVIVSIEANGPIPSGALQVDGRDQFLIPGLIDAHVHLRRQPNDLLLYLANGVTQIRDLSGSTSDIDLRRELGNDRAGPRLAVASPSLFSAGILRGMVQEMIGSRLNAGSADNADALVRDLLAQGYDAIKLYTDLDLDTFDAVTAAARAQGLHTVGHLPIGFALSDLATTDLREIAHIEEIVKALMREADATAYEDLDADFLAFVKQRSKQIVDDLLANEIAVNSTLWFTEFVGNQVFELEAQLHKLPLVYANPGMVQGSPYVKFGWLPGRNRFESTTETSPERRSTIETFWNVRAEAHRILLRAMNARGVPITAGTDATTELVLPGFSLHDEVESLNRNGMTTVEALRAATATAATAIGTQAGVIATRRPADMVLLRADPLAKINNTRAIEAVFVGGKYYDRQALDDMLAAVEAAHAKSRKFDLETLQLPD